MEVESGIRTKWTRVGKVSRSVGEGPTGEKSKGTHRSLILEASVLFQLDIPRETYSLSGADRGVLLSSKNVVFESHVEIKKKWKSAERPQPQKKKKKKK